MWRIQNGGRKRTRSNPDTSLSASQWHQFIMSNGNFLLNMDDKNSEIQNSQAKISSNRGGTSKLVKIMSLISARTRKLILILVSLIILLMILSFIGTYIR